MLLSCCWTLGSGRIDGIPRRGDWGDPGLLQKIPDIAAQLSSGGADRKQSAAGDGTLPIFDAILILR